MLDVDVEKERISLGIKQLASDPLRSEPRQLKKGDVVTCTVTAVTDGGIEVRSATASPASSARPSCRATAPSSGPTASPSARRSTPRSPRSTAPRASSSLSIKAREVEEEKKAMAEFGSSDSGASLGDILGAALSRRTEKEKDEK